MTAPLAARAEEPATTFIPTSGWLVGPASLIPSMPDAADKTPCIMANQYSNGYMFRFAGGGQKLIAMAVDFRQKLFESGTDYDMEFSFLPDAPMVLKAQAFDDATLIVNLTGHDDIYGKFKTAETMRMSVAGKAAEFALLGIGDGLGRVESCYNPASPSAAAPPPAEEEPPEESVLAEPLSAPPPVTTPQGQRLDQVWAPPQRQPQPKTKAETDARPRDIMAHSEPAPPPAAGADMRWRTIRGANLRDVLTVWGESAKVRLAWSAADDFTVPDSLAIQTSFEKAVEGLLSLYDPAAPRPVGRIYNDEVTGEKVLLIETFNPDS